MRAICPMALRRSVAFLAALMVPLWFGSLHPAAAQRAAQTAAAPSNPAQLLGRGGASLPLSTTDAARLQDVFALHLAKDWASAEQEAAALTDRRLEGHVLADRWLNPAAQSLARCNAKTS